MGHSYSPPLANLMFFLLFENRLVRPRWKEFGIRIYRRFLDDGCIILDSTVAYITRMMYEWNTFLPGITFTWKIHPFPPPRWVVPS